MDTDGDDANGDANQPALSADGRYVAFTAVASDLVPGDTNVRRDVFVRDNRTGVTTRVSVSSSGTQGNGHSGDGGPSISGDGRYVAFASTATNLVSGDFNNLSDVFVHDRNTGTTTPVSVSSTGNIVGRSFNPAVSSNGQYVAFESDADNLAGGAAGRRDIFRRQRGTGPTVLISVDSASDPIYGDTHNPAISSTGRYVAFDGVLPGSDNARDVLRRDATSGVTITVSTDEPGVEEASAPAISASGSRVAFQSHSGPGSIYLWDVVTGTRSIAGRWFSFGSVNASISADGQRVAFQSDAGPLEDDNDSTDVVVYEDDAGNYNLASRSATGALGNGDSTQPAMSGDGRYVAFTTAATNLVTDGNATTDVVVRSYPGRPMLTGVDRLSNTDFDAEWARPRGLSGDGRYALFSTRDFDGSGDDLIRRDRLTGTDELIVDGVSLSDGKALSANGRFAVFSTDQALSAADTNGTNDVYLYDAVTATKTLVSRTPGGGAGNGRSSDEGISANGDWVAFSSGATDLVPTDTNSQEDVFVWSRSSGSVSRVSLSSSGVQAVGGGSNSPAISSDGAIVAFGSGATNLVPGDTNATGDVFARNRTTNTTTRVSVSSNGAQANGGSGGFGSDLSANGRLVSFSADATNLVPGDTNGVTDVFVHDRQSGETTRVSVDSAGGQSQPSDAFGGNHSGALSPDGRYVVFLSHEGGLAAGNHPNTQDVFVHDRSTAKTALLNAAAWHSDSGLWMNIGGVATDGSSVQIMTYGELLPDDNNNGSDIYVLPNPLFPVRRVTVPHKVPAGATTAVRIFGEGLQPDVSLTTAEDVSITIVSVSPGGGVIDALVSVDADAPPGPRRLDATNPGTGPGADTGGDDQCPNCLEVG